MYCVEQEHLKAEAEIKRLEQLESAKLAKMKHRQERENQGIIELTEALNESHDAQMARLKVISRRRTPERVEQFGLRSMKEVKIDSLKPRNKRNSVFRLKQSLSFKRMQSFEDVSK